MRKHGVRLSIRVGGEREERLAEPAVQKAYASSRFGFVKLAIIHGVDIVPAYCFGEHEAYYTSKLFQGFRMGLVKSLGVALPLAWGRWWWLPWWPLKVPLTTVLGVPIKVKQSAAPTTEEVQAVHAQYVAGLKKLFDENKAELGYGGQELCVL
eukprot:TRINITY_DN30414_c0_g1_i1.p1 TRINITY_DN30414_c0_g1~~TRINITY_DN30414_c0_g1_i1.p1  ORF type:complete len:153 (-),score=37.53 TRINITY_DN30414_c0_g1_i1:81-539(-)